MNVEFHVLATDLAIPEGPVALEDGSILVVEILGGCLTRIAPDGTTSRVAETGGGPNGAAIGPDGKIYVCNNGGIRFIEKDGQHIPDPDPAAWTPGSIQVVDLASGDVEVLYDRSPDGHLGAPNDLVFDSFGGFWFTDHGRTWPGIRERGAVYYAKADGSHIERVITNIDGPNGIGLSADGATLLVAESWTAHVWSFDIVAPGRVSLEPGFFSPGGQIVGRAGASQFLDSLAIDSVGNVCVGTLGRGGILSIAPDGTSVHIPLPDDMVTNICFGGPDLRTAYVTMSQSGRLVAMDWPRPGMKLNYQR